MENLECMTGLTNSDILQNKKPKRGRGRPRKLSLKQYCMNRPTYSDLLLSKKFKRGRGRPRKSSLKQDNSGQNLSKYSMKQIDPEERISVNLLNGEHSCLQCDFVSLSKTEALRHSTRDHLSLKVFTCLRCPKMFQLKKKCLSHVKETHAGMLNECEICEKKYITQFILFRHYRLKHPELEVFSCEGCPNEFTSEIKLQDHQIAIHSKVNVENENEDKKYSCMKCIALFETSQQLKEHQIEAHIKWFNCNQCKYRSDLSANTERHVKAIHSKEKDFMCPGCFKTVTDRKTLEVHIKSNKAEKGSSIMTCEKYTKIIIKDSELIHHDKEEDIYSCLLCSFGSINLRELKSHIDVDHHKSKKRTFVCNQCKGDCPTRAAILKHWDIDHKHVMSLGEAQVKQKNLNSLKCKHCGLQFNYEKTLYLHTKKLHSGHSWTCEGCSTKFLTKKTIIEHVKTIHQNDASITIPKPLYHCSECQNTFDKRTQCNYHLKQTHPLRNAEAKTQFKCELCVYMTDDGTNMRRHMKIIHRKQKDYMCKGCSRSFGEKSTYELHASINMPDGNSKLMTCMKYNIVSMDTKDLIHQSKDMTFFLCLLCNLSSPNENEMAKHINNDHERARMIKFCKLCHLELGRTSAKISHHWKKFHPNIDSLDNIPKEEVTMSSHSCNLCDKQFKYSKLLQIHSKTIHPKEKLVSCNKCHLKFKSKRLSTLHNHGVHLKGKKFRCAECVKSYCEQKGLNKHIIKKHSDIFGTGKYIVKT